MVIRVNAIEREFTRQVEALEQRIDAFFEYLLSMVFDNIAKPKQENNALADLMPQRGEGSRRWQSLVNEIAPHLTTKMTADNASSLRSSIIDLKAANFMDGWNGIEFDAHGNAFRWMKHKGYLNIPVSEDCIDRILVTTGSFYKGVTCPIYAAINGRKAHVQMTQLSFSGNHELSISVPPKPADSNDSVSVLTLESEMWGTPAEDISSDDDRELSIMVRQVCFLQKEYK